MKLLKSEIFKNIVYTVAVVLALTILTIACLNVRAIKLDVQDGQEIFVEYGSGEALEVTAVYREGLFNPGGTKVQVKVDGDVDYKKLGTYTVTYSADYKGKDAKATVNVVVRDTTPPKIELVSDPDYFTRPIDEYVEEGFKATDIFDGDLTDKVVRTEKDGVVTYFVKDSIGNATTVKREIVYKDVVAPTITLVGGESVNVNVGTAYTDFGYVASDDCDGIITDKVQIDGQVDINTYGQYLLTYKVKDEFGNVTEATRTVNVGDFAGPVVTLKGKRTMYVKLGDSFVDPGISANDNVDGEVTAKVTASGTVDTSKIGQYTINYSVTDAAGNVSNEKRTVYVYQKQAVNNAVNPGNKVVYLTFDDGPGAYTERLLNILDKFGVKATFFVTNQRPAFAHMIGEAHRRGHEIALHTYTHNYAIYTSEETYYADLKKINDLVIAQTGEQATIVRFPGGTSNKVSYGYSNGIMTMLSQTLAYHGYLYCDWNVSSGDAGGAWTKDEVVQNVINGIKGHNVSIVLQHDIKSYSVEATAEILAWGLANGYTFLPMDETTPMVHHRPNN